MIHREFGVPRHGCAGNDISKIDCTPERRISLTRSTRLGQHKPEEIFPNCRPDWRIRRYARVQFVLCRRVSHGFAEVRRRLQG